MINSRRQVEEQRLHQLTSRVAHELLLIQLDRIGNSRAIPLGEVSKPWLQQHPKHKPTKWFSCC